MARKSKKQARTPRRPSAMDSLADHYRQVLGPTATVNEPAPDNIPSPVVPENQEQRICTILGVPADAPRPEVTEENLRRYHRYLTKQLKMPFQAKSVEPGFVENPKERFVVFSLPEFDPKKLDEGIQCAVMLRNEIYELPLADVRPSRNQANRTLIEDYASWLEPTGESEATLDAPPFGWKMRLGIGVVTAVVGACHGAVVGATTATLDGAVVAVRTGALLLGLATFAFTAVVAHRYGRWWAPGAFIGTIGAVIGCLLGAFCMAFVGSLAGAVVVGTICFVLGGRKAGLRVGLGMFVGAALGTVIQAIYADADAAWTGIWQGCIAGAVGGPLVFIAMSVLASLWSIPAQKMPSIE